MSTLDLATQLPSTIKEHAACDKNGTTLNARILEEDSKHHLVEDGVTLSASQLANGQVGFQVEHHRLQAEHLSQVLYNGHTLVPSVSPPPSQFCSPHQVRYSSVGSQPDTSPHPHNITDFDAPCHLITLSLLELLESISMTTRDAFGSSVFEHDPSPQAVVSLRGGSSGDGSDALPVENPLNDPSDHEEYLSWTRHYHLLTHRLDLDISGVYYNSLFPDKGHRAILEFYSELWFLVQDPYYQTISVTSDDGYQAFRNSLSTRKLARFDRLFGPPFPKTIDTFMSAQLQTFFHHLTDNQKDRFRKVIRSTTLEPRFPITTSFPQRPASLYMLIVTFLASVQLKSLRHQHLVGILNRS